MGDSGPTFKAWMLPLVVLAIAVPISVAMAFEGPGLGLAVGALAAAVILVLAARMHPDEPIEVARSSDGRRHVLIVAGEAVEDPAAVEQVIATLPGDGRERPDDILILAPARNKLLDHWATDLEPGRREAQRKLVLSVAALAAADVEARGKVGDPDLLQAAEDALRSFPADEVILVSAPEDDRGTEKLAREMRRRLRVPFTRVRSGEPEAARSASPS